MRNTKIEQPAFPEVFCVEDIQCMPVIPGRFDYLAVLYHDQACISVSFSADQPNPRLKTGCYVSINWAEAIQSNHGSIKVDGLKVLSCMECGFNPFLNVPYRWKMNRHLVNCARNVWDMAPQAPRRMLMAILASHFACREAANCSCAFCAQVKKETTLATLQISG